MIRAGQERDRFAPYICRWRVDVTNNQTRLGFAATLFLVGGIYLLLPHLRLSSHIVSLVRWAFAWIAVVYLILGLLTNREGGVFFICRSFAASAGAIFLVLNFLPLSYWAAGPLLFDKKVESKRPVAVVLGGGINRDGTPTESSIRRVVQGAQLYHAGLARTLLFSTGVTSKSEISEAQAMARFALSLGVPQKAILLEKSSVNTDENARFSSDILRKRGVNRILLVTDPIHMFRAKESFQHYGIFADPAPTVDKELIEMEARGRWNLFHRVLHEYIGIAYYRAKRFLAS